MSNIFHNSIDREHMAGFKKFNQNLKLLEQLTQQIRDAYLVVIKNYRQGDFRTLTAICGSGVEIRIDTTPEGLLFTARPTSAEYEEKLDQALFCSDLGIRYGFGFEEGDGIKSNGSQAYGTYSFEIRVRDLEGGERIQGIAEALRVAGVCLRTEAGVSYVN